MSSFPSSGHHSFLSRRDERGVAFPSPLVLLSVLAVAMASITFVATRDQAPTERRVDTATIASADQTPTPEAEPRGETEARAAGQAGRGLRRGLQQLRHQGPGRHHRGEGHHRGLVRRRRGQLVRRRSRTTTVYFPPRLKAAGKQLALDLGIKRTAPAVGEMKRDRLTIILTTDAPR